jgi:GT2 family glycosyltransferase
MRINLNYIGVDQSNRSAQLNAAISQARGQILAFADDDCILPPDWLNKLGGVFERESNIGVVGGQDQLGTNEPPFNVAMNHVLNSFMGTGGLRQVQGPSVGKYYPKLWNMAIPRDVALSVALKSQEGLPHVFDETLDVHEDVELVDRIEKTGKRIIFSPEVLVMHSRDTTLPSFTKRSFNMARTSRSVGVHRLPHLLLATFASGMIALIITSAFIQQLRIVLAIVGTMYVAVLLMSALGGFMRERQYLMFIHVPVLLIALHFSRGLGYLFPWQRRV